MTTTITLVPGRSCDGCSMCCKLPEIKALTKPRDTWCTHCSTHKKCDIYLDRPEPCRDYYCGWMRLAKLPEEWRPLDSRMMINFTEDGRHLFIHVDPSRPDAWPLPFRLDGTAPADLIALGDGHYVRAHSGSRVDEILARAAA